jgi:hypothetical protein
MVPDRRPRGVGHYADSIREYGRAVVRSWYSLIGLVLFGLGLVLVFKPDLKVPLWVAIIVLVFGFSFAQFAAFHEIRLDREVDRLMLAETQRNHAETMRELSQREADRELAWRPHLVRTDLPESTDGKAIELRNMGRGPAVSCIYCASDGPRWWKSNPVHLNAAEPARVIATLQDGFPPGSGSGFEIFAPNFRSQRQEAIFCQDRFGREYRFHPAIDQAPDVWLGGKKIQPMWVAWYTSALGLD